MELKTNIVFIDFETTGINVFDSDPIELGAVLVNKNLTVEKTFSSLIQPRIKSKMRASSRRTHGHSMNQLLDKPNDKAVLSDFFDIFGTDYCFGGWNISFDIPYFKKMCFRNHMMKTFNSINYRHVDVQSIVRFATEIKILPSYIFSLDDMITYLNLNRSLEHNALADALLTVQVYRELLDLFSQAYIPILNKISNF